MKNPGEAEILRLERVRELIVGCQQSGLPHLPFHHMGEQSQITLPITDGVFVTVVCSAAGLGDIDPLLLAQRRAFLRKRGRLPADEELN